MNFRGINISENFKQQLSVCFDNGKLPHAIILEGASELQRKETAKFIAKALVCTSDEEKPCGVCAQCHKAEIDSHSDIIHVVGSSRTGMMSAEDIRSMRNNAYVVPNEAAHKVYIFHNAGEMSEQTQNMLLKILEEPPPYVRIILECEDKSALIETVRSRSTVFRLSQTADDGLSEQKKEKAFLLAQEIAQAMLSGYESDLMAVFGSFEKNFDLLPHTLRSLTLIIRDAVVMTDDDSHLLGGSAECAKNLATHFTASQLMKVMNNIEELLESVEHNGNKNLILTRCCYLIRRSIGR